MSQQDDSLWDPEAPADDEVRRLEEALRRHRYRPRRFHLPEDEPVASASRAGGVGAGGDDPFAGEVPEAAPGSWWASLSRRGPGRRGAHLWQLLAAAAVLLVLLADVLDWSGPAGDGSTPAGEGYELQFAEGDVRIEGTDGGVPHRGRRLRAGEVLVVDEAATARVSLGPEGWFDVGPRSRLHLAAAGGGDDEALWRPYLERGELSASIFAAPRLFQLGTPSGIAVDLGCIYTATVDDDGVTRLTVRGGQVSFETAARKVFVPAGAQVVARPGRGPGTPTWEDGPAELARAVDRLDEPRKAWTDEDERALATVLAVEDRRHTLTLWHLLEDPRPRVRRPVTERLLALAPPPGDVSRQGVLSGDPQALAAWRDALERWW